MASRPQFREVARLDELALSARLDAVRAAIAHGGEKGRSLEAAATEILRTILPAEYGLSTGFVAYHGAGGSIQLTSQLDIIIYDAVRGGPLIRLGACDVFPIESVYAHVEVKARLVSASNYSKPRADSLEACIKTGTALNKIRTRQFLVPVTGSPVSANVEPWRWENMRSFVLAFSIGGALRDADSTAHRLAASLARYGKEAHLHGLFIPAIGFFRARPVAPGGDLHHVQYHAGAALAEFRTELLAALDRFPRFAANWSPALSRYFSKSKWREASPSRPSA